jgi:hypothetical protein
MINGNGARQAMQTSHGLGFTHLGRFSAMYSRQFDERPSETLAKSLGLAWCAVLILPVAIEQGIGCPAAISGKRLSAKFASVTLCNPGLVCAGNPGSIAWTRPRRRIRFQSRPPRGRARATRFWPRVSPS